MSDAREGRVVSLSGGNSFPKIPGIQYGSGAQWFVVSREFAEMLEGAIPYRPEPIARAVALSVAGHAERSMQLFGGLFPLPELLGAQKIVLLFLAVSLQPVLKGSQKIVVGDC